jgi:hypothetical protein
MGTASGTYTKSVDVGNATSTTISLNPGTTYYFVVKALNAPGVESPASNEVSYLAP